MNRVSPATSIYCTWWTFIDYTLCSTGEFLMATISIQRHMLIFHGQLLRMPMRRILLNHVPLILCLIYPSIFYLFSIILYPCDTTQWDFNEKLCGLANCYLLFNPILSTFDWVFNNGVPIIVTVFANLALAIRIILQKRRFHRSFTWHHQKRMATQLFLVSTLYIIAWIPCVIVALVHLLGYRDFLADIQNDYLLDLNYLVCFFLPYVCLSQHPKLAQWTIKSHWRQTTAVPN
ncbi:unnamed protein product [Rotaria sp. Silwood1]|nr:unnamed protein product [Rotaria sp. Silwood1]